MSAKPHRHSGLSKAQKQVQKQRQQTPPSFSPSDFEKVGPRSIDGVEASDLPDEGRGPVETNPGKELRRKLPQATGAIAPEEDMGMPAQTDITNSKVHGHRNKN